MLGFTTIPKNGREDDMGICCTELGSKFIRFIM